MGSPTFAHFFLAIALVIGLFPERVGRIGRFGLAFCSVAGPFGILLTPLYAVRWLLIRDRDAAWRAAAVAIPAAAQVVTLLAVGHRPDVARDTSVIDAFAITATHLSTMVLGSHLVGEARLVPMWVGVTVACAVIVILVSVLARLPRLIAGVVVYLIVATIVSTMAAGTTDPTRLLGPQSAARYFFVVGAVVAGAAMFGAARGSRPAAILVGLVALGWVGDFMVPPLPPSSWATESACFDTQGPCTVHVYSGGAWDIHWIGDQRGLASPSASVTPSK
jgi:MFS family permease